MSENDATLQELDLSIPNMHSTDEEKAAAAALHGVPGIGALRMVQRGALIHYRPSVISHEEICNLLRKAGFRATIFQDSATGATGLSSV